MTNDDQYEQINELASRLVDGEITVDDVAIELRPQVLERSRVFAQNRFTLLHDHPQIAATDIDIVIESVLTKTQQSSYHWQRRVLYGVVSAAAAIVLVVLGVSSLSTSKNENLVSQSLTIGEQNSKQMETLAGVATDAGGTFASPQTETSAQSILQFDSLGDIADYLYQQDPPTITARAQTPELCPNSLRPSLGLIILAGQTVELHFTPMDGLIVYDITDCSVIGGVTP